MNSASIFYMFILPFLIAGIGVGGAMLHVRNDKQDHRGPAE